MLQTGDLRRKWCQDETFQRKLYSISAVLEIHQATEANLQREMIVICEGSKDLKSH